MKEMSISELKAKLSILLNQVQKTKKPIRIMKFNQPLVEIVPAPRISSSDWMGSMKETIEINGDIVSPASETDDWEALQE